MQPEASERSQGGIAVALDDPGPSESFSRPGNACRAQKDETWSALPSGHGCRKFLSDRHPYLATGLDLTDVDAGEPVVDLKICPPHLDQIRTALPGIGCQRDDSRQLRPSMCLGKPHLLVGPWLVAVVRSRELDPGCDQLGYKIAHDCPALDLAEGGERRSLLARSVGQAVHECLHQSGPQDVHGYRAERIRPFGKPKLAAPYLSRCWRVALKFWARHECADDRSEALVSDLRCAKWPVSCHF